MSRRRGPNFLLLALGLILSTAFVTLLGVGFQFNPFALPDAMLNKAAPSFSLTDLDGNQVDLNDFEGQPVVINFWSTWCVPCKQEHPVLLEAAKLYPEVNFLGVIYQDKPEPIRNYLKRNGTAYPHLIDSRSHLAIDMGVTGVPETYFIDRKGIIRHKSTYPVSLPYLAEKLEPLLSVKP